MDPLTLKKLNAERLARRACLAITELDTGRDRLVKHGDPVPGALGDAIAEAFAAGTSRRTEIAGRSYFLNVYQPPVRVVVIGAVHISQAMVPVIGAAGFELTIIDPRTAFATPERFSGCDVRAEWPVDALEGQPLDPFTALVAVTHDPKIDDWPLMAALEAGCFYVGALGSRKTHQKRVERLASAGVPPDAIEHIHAPIGLDIGAANPAEIAIAIAAEIVAALRGPKWA